MSRPNYLTCPYCGGKAHPQDSKRIYGGRSYGDAYICENYPKCDTYVGTHKKDGSPLGTLADAKLRERRQQVHALFDPIWEKGKLSRNQAYSCLSALLKLPASQTHVACFDTRQCQTALGAIQGWLGQRGQFTGTPRGAYAGIGARATPTSVLQRMRALGKELANAGWLLRSGAAPGADSAFETGCHLAWGQNEIYLPWRGFEHHPSTLLPSAAALGLASNFHPGWGGLKQGVKKMMARNAHQLLGPNLDSPAKMIICWTEGGKAIGGTGQSLRMADAYEIPVINLYFKDWREKLDAILADQAFALPIPDTVGQP